MTKKNKLTEFRHSHLETTPNVTDTLEWKIASLKEDNLPVDTSLADYISFTLDNLEAQKDQLKSAEKMIKERKKELDLQIENIKVYGAKFFLANGFEKLDGVVCSSVSVTKGREEKTEEVNKEEIKYLISQDEIDELLVGLGKAEMVTATYEKITVALPPKLRVNKRKIALSEVVDEN